MTFIFDIFYKASVDGKLRVLRIIRDNDDMDFGGFVETKINAPSFVIISEANGIQKMYIPNNTYKYNLILEIIKTEKQYNQALKRLDYKLN